MALLDELAAAALALVTPVKTACVVEVEAGLGALTLQLAPHVAHVDALDGSKAIVLALRARVAVARLGNVEVRVGDPAALPFPEHRFDAGYCLSAAALPERSTVLVELRRVLKPGAPAVAAAADRAERDGVLEDFVVAGFDEVQAHAVEGLGVWLVAGVA